MILVDKRSIQVVVVVDLCWFKCLESKFVLSLLCICMRIEEDINVCVEIITIIIGFVVVVSSGGGSEQQGY